MDLTLFPPFPKFSPYFCKNLSKIPSIIMFMSGLEFLIIAWTGPTYAIRLKYSLNPSHCLCFPYLRNVWKDFSLGLYISVADPSYTRRGRQSQMLWGNANLLLGQFFQRTVWKWKKNGPRGDVRSVNVWSIVWIIQHFTKYVGKNFLRQFEQLIQMSQIENENEKKN